MSQGAQLSYRGYRCASRSLSVSFLGWLVFYWRVVCRSNHLDDMVLWKWSSPITLQLTAHYLSACLVRLDRTKKIGTIALTLTKWRASFGRTRIVETSAPKKAHTVYRPIKQGYLNLLCRFIRFYSFLAARRARFQCPIK